MYDVCVAYVRLIGPAMYVLRIFKCTHKNVYPRPEEYELRIEEYELHVAEYELRMYDARVTYLSYLDTP